MWKYASCQQLTNYLKRLRKGNQTEIHTLNKSEELYTHTRKKQQDNKLCTISEKFCCCQKNACVLQTAREKEWDIKRERERNPLPSHPVTNQGEREAEIANHRETKGKRFFTFSRMWFLLIISLMISDIRLINWTIIMKLMSLRASIFLFSKYPREYSYNEKTLHEWHSLYGLTVRIIKSHIYLWLKKWHNVLQLGSIPVYGSIWIIHIATTTTVYVRSILPAWIS